MSRTMVGLLSAAGAVVAALVGGTGGWMEAVLIAFAGTATGLAAYLALPPSKKAHPASDIRQYQKLSATIPAARLPAPRCPGLPLPHVAVIDLPSPKRPSTAHGLPRPLVSSDPEN